MATALWSALFLVLLVGSVCGESSGVAGKE